MLLGRENVRPFGTGATTSGLYLNMALQPRVLIAEDDSALAKIIAFNLDAAGFEATIACNGSDAWECSQRARYDLLVTDYDIPHIKGTDLCRKLRQDERYTRLPIILITGFSRDLDVARLDAELELSATFCKPLELTELVHTAKAFVECPPRLALKGSPRQKSEATESTLSLTEAQRETMLKLGDPLFIDVVERDEAETVEQLIDLGLLWRRESGLAVDFTDSGASAYDRLAREKLRASNTMR